MLIRYSSFRIHRFQSGSRYALAIIPRDTANAIRMAFKKMISCLEAVKDRR
jgi:hypothetical protein